jgi:hypothetical protein
VLILRVPTIGCGLARPCDFSMLEGAGMQPTGKAVRADARMPTSQNRDMGHPVGSERLFVACETVSVVDESYRRSIDRAESGLRLE